MRLDFSERVMNVFSEMNTDYESMANLMQDVALRREMADGISYSEANEKIHEFSLKVLGINDVKDHKAVRRAIRDHAREWYDVIEDTLEVVIEVGYQENEWFQSIVDYRNIGAGDRQDFFVDTESILAVSNAGKSHHDHIIQRIGEGAPISVPTTLHAVKVGADINRYVVGQVDWVKLIDAIAKAYILDIQEEIASQVDVIATKLPVQGTQFVNTGALSSSTKDAFDEIIANVSAANGGSDVVIMGSMLALKKINALVNGDLFADGQKDSNMNTGNIGIYDGSRLVPIPNRFKDRTYTTKTFSDKKLLILPVVGDDGKFIKMVDRGETLVLTKDERGDYLSDIMTHEVQREYGVATAVGRQLGVWTLP